MHSTLLQLAPSAVTQHDVGNEVNAHMNTMDDLANSSTNMLDETADDAAQNHHHHDHNTNDESPKRNEYSNQSLDEFVAEHCQKIGIGDANSMSMGNIEIEIPSPSDKFQNMCLYSPPPEDAYQAALETIDETAFKQFLYGNGM